MLKEEALKQTPEVQRLKDSQLGYQASTMLDCLLQTYLPFGTESQQSDGGVIICHYTK